MALTTLGLTTLGGAGGFTCLTGTVVPQAAIGIPFPGNFLLQVGGANVAALVDAGAGLSRFVGQRVTVCGFSAGVVEGLPVLRATTVIGAGGFPPVGFPPIGFPPFGFRVQCFIVPSFGGALGLGGGLGLGGLGGVGLGGLGGVGLGGLGGVGLGGLGGLGLGTTLGL